MQARRHVPWVVLALACTSSGCEKAAALRRERSGVDEECPAQHAFSPPLPEARLSAATRARSKVCGGPTLDGDLAAEKVFWTFETGDGLGGRNGRAVEYWLLVREDGRWKRHLLLGIREPELVDAYRDRRVTMARDGSRVAVVVAARIGVVADLQAKKAPVVREVAVPEDDSPRTLLGAVRAR
jgi:hypothetical protein